MNHAGIVAVGFADCSSGPGAGWFYRQGFSSFWNKIQAKLNVQREALATMYAAGLQRVGSELMAYARQTSNPVYLCPMLTSISEAANIAEEADGHWKQRLSINVRTDASL